MKKGRERGSTGHGGQSPPCSPTRSPQYTLGHDHLLYTRWLESTALLYELVCSKTNPWTQTQTAVQYPTVTSVMITQRAETDRVQEASERAVPTVTPHSPPASLGQGRTSHCCRAEAAGGRVGCGQKGRLLAATKHPLSDLTYPFPTTP